MHYLWLALVWSVYNSSIGCSRPRPIRSNLVNNSTNNPDEVNKCVRELYGITLQDIIVAPIKAFSREYSKLLCHHS